MIDHGCQNFAIIGTFWYFDLKHNKKELNNNNEKNK